MGDTTIITTLNNGVRTIILNRPNLLNPFNQYAYSEITRILNADAVNDTVVVTLLTGVGKYYSSGTQLSRTTSIAAEAEYLKAIIKNFIDVLIDYPKILIAVLNGPAYGIAATTLALCDIVYASDRAIISTPFIRIGVTPEGCSTYTYPRLLGRSKASELLLLLGEQMTAQEALTLGLVAKVIPHEDLDDFIKELHKYGKLPVNSVKKIKEAIMAPIKSKLHETAKSEFIKLWEAVNSPEALKSKELFWAKRNKL